MLTRPSELNSLLDLDKGDQQGADSGSDLKDEPDISRDVSAKSRGRDELAKMAEAYMRTSGTAIREIPIAERTPPQMGPVTGRAVAKDEAHVGLRPRPAVLSSCHRLLWDATYKSANDYLCGFIKAARRSTEDMVKKDSQRDYRDYSGPIPSKRLSRPFFQLSNSPTETLARSGE